MFSTVFIDVNISGFVIKTILINENPFSFIKSELILIIGVPALTLVPYLY